MALRTIEAPGVEIKEIDKSGYTPVMTGTRCFVMGYSDKGTPYEPMQFTSKAAWQNYYGDPDNEAERYFYNACSEVINQNGVLYCARLPYDNDAYGKMVGYKFKVSTMPKHIPTASEYIKNNVWSTVSHDKDFEQDALDYTFNNLLNREIDGNLNSIELDDELRKYYKTVVVAFDAKYKSKKDRYSVEYYDATVLSAESIRDLSARFLTEQEANEYVKEFENAGVPGIYKYYTVLSDCVKYDMGDWIAQPLCCVFKKCISGDTWDEPSTPSEISASVKSLMDKYPSKKYYTTMETLAKVSYNVDILDQLISEKKTEDRNTLNTVINWLKENQSSDATTKEMRKYSAYKWMDTNLSGTFSFNAMEVYKGFDGIGSQPRIFTIPKCPFKEVVNDGYDNEPMFRETVEQLYVDLNLSNDSQAQSLYDSELWRPALSCSLARLIRDRSTTYDQLKEQWNADNKEISSQKFLSSWNDMLLSFVNNTDIKFKDVIEKYGPTKEAVHAAVPYYPIVDGDPTMCNYLEITNSESPIACELTAVDEYRTGEANVPANTFWVFDKTCATLNSVTEDTRKGKDRQMIGIFPVITTAANAMYAQSLIDVDPDFITDFETIDTAVTKVNDNTSKPNELLSTDIVKQYSNVVRTAEEKARKVILDTVSIEANGYFLPIQMNSQQTGFDTENTKKIGVIVFKAYLDASEGNKVSFVPVESFCGSLDKDAKNANTGVSEFIDRIVNTNSDYIYFFSNCFVNTAQKKTFQNTDIFICNTTRSGMLGWFSTETVENISLTSIYDGIEKCFRNVEDINERDIDIVCDAGIANIAQFMKSIYDGNGAHAYDLAATDSAGNPLIKMWKCNSADSIKAWKTVQFKYDTFCKNVRKDCMFIADGPRPLVLQGEKKIVRASKPANTIDANILPNVKYITGLNTNYGAGYMDWFQVTDEFTGDEFWCPPSIKAMGVYINTDLNFNYWDAPAGLNRGVIQALDCAFSPTIKQAGPIYQKNWNYAINYPYDGIVLEGQKTFQVKPSAFDRVNVRRLFLRLERQTYKVARYFVYEGNTAYTRQRLIDMLDPLFYTAKVGGGIYDYKIICDESNNTPNVIDNNELRVKIGIKPVKTAEFILIDFIALATGGSFSEM